MSQSTCPSRDRFVALLEGKLSNDNVDLLASHVEGCPACAKTIATMNSDTLSDALRTGAKAGGAESQESGLKLLMERLTAKSPTVADQTIDSVSGQNSGPSDTSENSEILAVLGKPQAAGEIGRLGDYRVLRQLGQGGMGMVFEAEDVKLERRVALKVMKPAIARNVKHRERFLREAKTAAKVESDYICPIYQVGEENGAPFIAMPFLKGEALDARIKRGERFTVEEVIRIGTEIAEGLGAAHEAGLIHRDIKPANIWMETQRSGPSRARILDFGLARAQVDDIQITQSGAILGTPAYMSPEQARGDKNVDGRADLFSLGCVLYSLTTGDMPFKADTTIGVLMALATKTPPSPRERSQAVPEELSDLVMALLAKDADNRPSDAKEVMALLAEVPIPDIAQKFEAPVVKKSDKTAVLSSNSSKSGDTMTSDAPAKCKAGMTTIAKQEKAPHAAAPPNRRTLMVLIAVVAIAFLGGLFLLLGGGVYYIVTDKGTIEIQTLDEKVQISLLKNGQEIEILDPTSKKTWAIRTGTYTLRLKDDPDGLEIVLPHTFEMKRGDKHVVTIRKVLGPIAKDKGLDPKTVPDKKQTRPQDKDADRRAAVFALSLGGEVKVNDQADLVKAAAGLPAEPFRLTGIFLQSNKQVSDAGLANFKDCENLTHLDLSYSKASDAGLAHFENCKNLKFLDLSYTNASKVGLAHFKNCKNLTTLILTGTQVTDEGLAHFKDCKLTTLRLVGTRVGDAGIAYFKDCKNLSFLDLADTKVTNAGLVHIKDCKDLNILTLASTQVTDAGLAYLKDCKNLGQLQLGSTRVTDDGLAHFKDCKKLAILGLNETQVTDKGVAQFKDCKNLGGLDLRKTKVTAIGIGELKRALPNCQIDSDVGGTEPSNLDPDRKAAVYVLSIGGAVQIKEQAEFIGAVANLPPGEFQLATVHLLSNPKVTDAGLAHFKNCKNLVCLRLSGSPVSDEGLAHLKDGKNLTELGLDSTQVTNKGLAIFKDIKNLRALGLDATNIGDTGLAHFKDCLNLAILNLQGTQVSDQGLVYLKDCKDLMLLGLANTKVGDAGMAHVKDCKKLTSLYLNGTQVSDQGLVHFKGCQHLTHLNLSDTKVNGTGLAHFNDSKNLVTLNLSNTQVGNEALGHLKSFNKLNELNLQKTKFTAEAIAELKKALPDCKIVSDFAANGSPATPSQVAAKQLQEEWATKLKLQRETENKLGMKLILIPPAGAVLPKPYFLGKYEVTQKEWEQVMGYNPSEFGPKNPMLAGMDTSKFPVEKVNWYDSVEFCNKLSELENLKPYYELKVTKRNGKAGKQIEEAVVKILGGTGYHIPTDAEWERACRAGTKSQYHCGDKDDDLLEFAWFDKNSDRRTHAVGEKRPNAFGLYDMHGNVMEWNEEMLTTERGPERVSRGGDLFNAAGNCAASARLPYLVSARHENIGLRVGRTP